MELIYATKNQAKLNFMKEILCKIGIDICGLDDIGLQLEDVIENGKDPLENARIKATAYYSAIKKPLFSCDSGLYLEGLPDELQPGVNVRNVGGRRLNDDEMINYYSSLARNAGGKIAARYKNGICLIVSDNQIYSYMGDDISYARFIITDKPHAKRVSGFPIDSLSIQIETGKYYYDLEESPELERTSDIGFINFFRNSIG